MAMLHGGGGRAAMLHGGGGRAAMLHENLVVMCQPRSQPPAQLSSLVVWKTRERLVSFLT